MNAYPFETLTIPTNGIHLHAVAAGPQNGPLVVLLHGFPEYWGSFARQIGPLASAGFRVVVPDQRGYNLSDKPRGVEAYRINQLVRDVIGTIDHLGHEKAILVGHDWGAAVAWDTAIHYPQRIERLAILNVPHPAALARALTCFTRQVLRSWYIYFFQIPVLPEFLLSRAHYAPLRRMMQASANPGTFSDEDLRSYTEAWSQPATLTSMINWYRAAGRSTISRGRKGYLQDAHQRVTVPTLILWGERDVALIPEMAAWSLEWCDQGELVRFPDATHWVQHDKAEQVNQRLLGFFAGS